MSSRMAPAPDLASHPSSVDMIRELAGRGELVLSELPPPTATAARSAAYHLAWPLVFERHTRALERRKGHRRCAAAVTQLAAPCLDGFHDDVESVVDHLFAHGTRPIHNLEGWITSRVTVATIDGHRRRRGALGAQQRPRVPQWLVDALDDDPWLVTLARKILEWVGVTADAGPEMWPLDTWAEQRAATPGHRAGHERVDVARDVTYVLDLMRTTRPTWYDTYVERPLSRKEANVVATDWRHDTESPAPLALTSPADRDDAELDQLAVIAVQALATGLAAGGEPREVVRLVVQTLFAGCRPTVHDLAAMPHTDRARDELLSAALACERTLDRIVESALSIVGGPDGQGRDCVR